MGVNGVLFPITSFLASTMERSSWELMASPLVFRFADFGYFNRTQLVGVNDILSPLSALAWESSRILLTIQLE